MKVHITYNSYVCACMSQYSSAISSCSLVTCSSSSQLAGRLGKPASSLPPPSPPSLLVVSLLLDLPWHCPLPLHIEGGSSPASQEGLVQLRGAAQLPIYRLSDCAGGQWQRQQKWQEYWQHRHWGMTANYSKQQWRIQFTVQGDSCNTCKLQKMVVPLLQCMGSEIMPLYCGSWACAAQGVYRVYGCRSLI